MNDFEVYKKSRAELISDIQKAKDKFELNSKRFLISIEIDIIPHKSHRPPYPKVDSSFIYGFKITTNGDDYND